MSRASLSAAIAAVVALLLFLSFCGAVKAEPAMQDQMFTPSVQLNGNCSATLIYSNRDQKSGEVITYALTAKHCIESAAASQILDIPRYLKNRIVGYDRMVAKVKSQDYKSDLALLVMRDTDRLIEKIASIAPADMPIAMGDPVWVVGHPLGRPQTVTQGMFGSYEELDFPVAGTEYIRTTADIAPGNSGGALFAKSPDGKYVLLGVTQVGMKMFSYMAFFGTPDAIRDFLGRAAPEVVGKVPPPPLAGIGSN